MAIEDLIGRATAQSTPNIVIRPQPEEEQEMPEMEDGEMESVAAAAQATNAKGFVTALFRMRDQAHKMHLATRSYAAHKALGEFYDEILDLTDTFVEAYQGKYGLMEIALGGDIPMLDAVEFMKMVAEYFEASRAQFAGDDWLQNMVDEMTGLAYRTLYKLRELQ